MKEGYQKMGLMKYKVCFTMNNIFPVEVIYDNACEKSSSASSKNTDKETNPRHRS